MSNAAVHHTASVLEGVLRGTVQMGATDDLREQYCRELGADPAELFRSLCDAEREHEEVDGKPAFLRYRRVVVEWVIELGDYFKLARGTTFAAVAILDRVRPDERYKRSQWQMVALTCLLLASKFFEREDKVPSLAQLERITQDELPPQLILSYELCILTKSDYNIAVVTHQHLIDVLLLEAVTSCHAPTASTPPPAPTFTTETSAADVATPVRSASAPSPSAPMPRLMHGMCRALSHAAVLDYACKGTRASAVAAASLLTARRLAGLQPAWPPGLADLAGYAEPELAEAADMVLSAARRFCGEELEAAVAVARVEVDKATRAVHRMQEAVQQQQRQQQQRQQFTPITASKTVGGASTDEASTEPSPRCIGGIVEA